MRLSHRHALELKRLARELAGQDASLWLFGSRLDDDSRGGDVDLLLDTMHPVDDPAPLAAHLAARASRVLAGRKVDVIVHAPNLKRLPIHTVALRTGVKL